MFISEHFKTQRSMKKKIKIAPNLRLMQVFQQEINMIKGVFRVN